ncbi:MAG TPA: outer membrane beta-barrel protein [Xanthobacteraceae bacterium]|nr:outer membrane beta-barrel protein [Xanthobacteraceae bacterium]
MRRTAIALIAAGVGFSQTAFAADLGRPAPAYKAPPPIVAPIYNWSGCYIGGNGGGVWVSKDWAVSGVGVAGIGNVNFGAVGVGGHDANSGIAGVQIGCNYQFAGGWVFGIQGDYDWMNANGSHLDPFGLGTIFSSNAKSLGSVTGRVGYAWDRFLGYVKGGWAWERDEYTWTIPAVAVLVGSETRGGWTVGVGAEYAFLDWLTGFVEYDYYDFGTRTVGLSFAPVIVNFDIQERKSVVKAGLNFKFGGGYSSPVAARY